MLEKEPDISNGHTIKVDLGMPFWQHNQSDYFDESLITWIEAINLLDKIELIDED